ncbi:uncharacterized protein LOC120910575 [Rana temporaria]|uniref:uncharacterized protein LOC120910575 n=1 Tax=Rana temporaria TaxID=8407 RepID=UPI001AAD16CE|nr:uncharacterized protein LOC120910575 [Rana temporaria]
MGVKVEVKAEKISDGSMQKGEVMVPIEEKESFHVTMENQPPLTSPDGSSNGNPPERCPRPLYSRDSTQEDHNYARCYQDDDLMDLKIKVKAEEEETYVSGDQPIEEDAMMVPTEEKESFHVTMENQPPLTSPDGSSNGNPPERCPRPLYSIQEDHNYSRCYQGDDLIDIKDEVKAEGHQSTEEGTIIVPAKVKEAFHVMMDYQLPLTSPETTYSISVCVSYRWIQ